MLLLSEEQLAAEITQQIARNAYLNVDYFPYVPVQTVRGIDTKTNTPVIAFKTRFGTLGNVQS